MPDPYSNETSRTATGSPEHGVALRILARSFYKELRSRGYTPKHLLALSTELIALITLELQKASAR